MIGQHRYSLQITTSPPDPRMWAEASTTGHASAVQTARCVEWIRDAITHKANRTPLKNRSNTVLALDAQHAAILASDAVMNAYCASGLYSLKYY